MRGLLLIVACFCLGTLQAGAQNTMLQAVNEASITTLQDLTASYFKSTPYNKSFSGFLQEIMNDPDLQDKVINRRTDSTFFYISGTYRRFNPFIHRPTILKLIVAESEFTDSDTSSYKDTVMYCQLLVTIDTTGKSGQFVKKEYNRLLRKAGRAFTHQTYALGQENSANKGEITNSFITPFAVSPLTIAWGRHEATHEYVLSISLRLKVTENRAAMVTLLNEPIMKANSP
jgi:hypothetical protein